MSMNLTAKETTMLTAVISLMGDVPNVSATFTLTPFSFQF
jgi:hypothetical protein